MTQEAPDDTGLGASSAVSDLHSLYGNDLEAVPKLAFPWVTTLSITHWARAESHRFSPISFPAVLNLRCLYLSSWTGTGGPPYSWPSLIQLLTDCKYIVTFTARFSFLTGLTGTHFQAPTILRLEEFEYFGYHPFLPIFFRTFSFPDLKKLTVDLNPDEGEPGDPRYYKEGETFSVPVSGVHEDRRTF